MNIYELIFIIKIVSGIMGVLILLTLFAKRNDILAFFYPQKYALITMLEADNNVSTWLQKKNSDLTFIFNQGTYNMFDMTEIKNPAIKEADNLLPPILYKKVTAIYRNGRLPQYFYNEGNENPFDYRNMATATNPQLRGQTKKVKTAELFIDDDSDIWSIMQKAIPFLLLIAVVIVIIILTKKPEAVAPVVTGG